MAPSRAVQLYRSLLQAHRKHLPANMRKMGDVYVRSEFKLHKKARPEHLKNFFTEWEDYLDQILATARAREMSKSDGSDDFLGGDAPVLNYGKNMTHDLNDYLTDDQKAQLEKLREETEKAGKKF